MTTNKLNRLHLCRELTVHTKLMLSVDIISVNRQDPANIVNSSLYNADFMFRKMRKIGLEGHPFVKILSFIYIV